MTREEASLRLEQILMTLARNSVHNKRLLEAADDLERYIAYLDATAAKEESEEKIEEVKDDDSKAE